MKKNVMVHIPKPCHEDWQQMTPVDKGRFCQSCAKQVVDFSMMTDQQVLQYISKAAGGMCGRFANDQLQRPLLPAKQEKKKMWWLAAAMPLMMVFGKAGAQKKKTDASKTFNIPKNKVPQVMGMIGIPICRINPSGDAVINTAREIVGRVLSDKGAILPFASVQVIDHPVSAMVDSTGNFTLKLHLYRDSIEIEASAIGYESVRMFVGKEQKNIMLTLKEKENNLPEVVVTDYGTLKGKVTLGGAIYGTKITYVEKVDTLIKSIFHIQPFTVYPNPAQRGQSITIDTKKQGDYSIQIFDNSGKLFQAKEFNAAEGATQTTLDIPSTLAAGMYYIRLVDDKTKKQYTDKIVVR